MQIALSDEQVPNLGSYWQARSMKIPVLADAVHAVGHHRQAEPARVGQRARDHGWWRGASTRDQCAGLRYGMHSLTRNQPATRRQIGEFYTTGALVNECSARWVCVSVRHLRLKR